MHGSAKEDFRLYLKRHVECGMWSLSMLIRNVTEWSDLRDGKEEGLGDRGS